MSLAAELNELIRKRDGAHDCDRASHATALAEWLAAHADVLLTRLEEQCGYEYEVGGRRVRFWGRTPEEARRMADLVSRLSPGQEGMP